MKTRNDFQAFYKIELDATVQELHKEKQTLLRAESNAPSDNPKIKKLKRRIILISIPLILFLLWLLPFGLVVFFLVFYIPICYMAINVGGRMGVSVLGEFRQKYKDQIIRKIIGFFEYSFVYEPLNNIPKDAVNGSLIFPEFAKGLIGEDYVQGTIDKTTFEFSEIFALAQKEPTVVQFFVSEEQKKKNQLKMMNEFNSMMAKMINPFFRGLFFIADFHKDFSCSTVVRPHAFTWGNQRFQKNFDGSTSPKYKVAARLKNENKTSDSWHILEAVQLEDPEFEYLYSVFSNDQVEARFVLTTGMMQRIKDFREKTRKQIFLSFQNSKMHIAIPYERSILEPKGVTKEHLNEYLQSSGATQSVLASDTADQNHINEFFIDLHFIFSLVEEFNLNTRIWTKRSS